MTDEDREVSRRMILSRLQEQTENLQSFFPTAILAAAGNAESRKQAWRHVCAMESELRMRRYFERGSVTDREGLIILDAIPASMAEFFISETTESSVRSIIGVMSKLRYDEEIYFAEESAAEWLRYQWEYAYENNQDDPRGWESPGDSTLWLQLFRSAMKRPCGYELTERLRELRRYRIAVLNVTNGRVRMRATDDNHCEYAAFRDKIKADNMATDLTAVLNGM